MAGTSTIRAVSFRARMPNAREVSCASQACASKCSSAVRVSSYGVGVAVSRSRRDRAARRRRRRMERVEHDLAAEQWTALLAAWGGCAYCGASDRALQRDCVLAISRGGRYTLDNVVPACGSCNASKSNAEVTGWLRRRRLDERSFLFIDSRFSAIT